MSKRHRLQISAVRSIGDIISYRLRILKRQALESVQELKEFLPASRALNSSPLTFL